MCAAWGYNIEYLGFFFVNKYFFSGPDCNNRLLCIPFNTFNIDISIFNTRVLKIKVLCETQSTEIALVRGASFIWIETNL